NDVLTAARKLEELERMEQIKYAVLEDSGDILNYSKIGRLAKRTGITEPVRQSQTARFVRGGRVSERSAAFYFAFLEQQKAR
ncbi:hypothetical protein, partial [Corallococcus praedator]|uniref:hypothetical protein n=1 Tax=Corallococcus praedator TaxID=2316724 RepID=UPI001ABF3122